MNPTESQALLETLATEREITRAILTYCRGSDHKDLELMRQAYHEDGYDDHGPFRGYLDDYLAWAAKNLERFHQLIDHVGPPAPASTSRRVTSTDSRCAPPQSVATKDACV